MRRPLSGRLSLVAQLPLSRRRRFLQCRKSVVTCTTGYAVLLSRHDSVNWPLVIKLTPLRASERPDHQDPQRQSVQEQSAPANLLHLQMRFIAAAGTSLQHRRHANGTALETIWALRNVTKRRMPDEDAPGRSLWSRPRRSALKPGSSTTSCVKRCIDQQHAVGPRQTAALGQRTHQVVGGLADDSTPEHTQQRASVPTRHRSDYNLTKMSRVE